MKTTVEISDALLEEAKRVAAEEHRTLRELVEDGLRYSLEQRRRSRTFRLRKATFKGKGLQAGIAAGSWKRIREAIYQGRGA